MSKRGGMRKGAGRPKNKISRVNKTIRISEEEWEIINPIVKFVKRDIDLGRGLLRKINKEDTAMVKDCEFINLTNKDITIYGSNHTSITIEKSGNIARCEQTDEPVNEICLGGCIFPISKRKYISTQNLPEPKQNVFFIVSYIVALQNIERNDLVVAADPIKNTEGKVVGYGSLNLI